MKRIVRKIFSPLPYILRWYLSRERSYTYKDIHITVQPGVFHPGFFFSTSLLLRYLQSQSLKGCTLLELGAGTGIISVFASRMGATVTATDISQKAVRNISANAAMNNVPVTIILSDLFKQIGTQSFDWIIVNPPYYPRNPDSEDAFAWYCGEHHEYFQELFFSVGSFMKDSTKFIMVLSDVCNIAEIRRVAEFHGFSIVKLMEREVWIDGKNYIFRFSRNEAGKPQRERC